MDVLFYTLWLVPIVLYSIFPQMLTHVYFIALLIAINISKHNTVGLSMAIAGFILTCLPILLRSILGCTISPFRNLTPHRIVVKMLRASGETGINLVTEIANSIVNEGVVPAEWQLRSIANSDALECGNYRGLKLLEHLMK